MTDRTTKIDTGAVKADPLDGLSDALAAAESPMSALAAAYNHAPHRLIRSFLNDKAIEILAVELPALQQSIISGPGIPAMEVANKTLTEMFEGAMAHITKEAPQEAPTATVQSVGAELAAVLDRGIKRVLLDDEWANRESFMSIVTAHARLVAALTNLALTPEQQAILDESLEQQRAAAGGNQ